MESCDALILGGGPAGSTSARWLKNRGLDVILMDKQGFPRDKVCAGWITPEVVSALQLDLEEYAAERVLQPISGFRTGLLRGSLVETRYGETVSYGIRRCEFDNYLLGRAGVRLRLGEGLESLQRTDGGWLVNGVIRTPLLIGAGGHFCPVARFLGARVGSSETAVAAKEVEFPLTPEQQIACEIDREIPELYFCQDLKGYAWCVRKGNYLNIGLGREDRHGLTQRLADFSSNLRQQGRIPADIPARFHGHAYLLHGHSPRRILDDGVLLVGDAAGLAYPESGEGIRPAVESALIAADVVLEAEGDYRRQRLEPYKERLRRRFGPGHPPVSSALLGSVRKLAARQLLANRWLTRRLVLDRWFLHRHQGALGTAG